MYKQSHGERCCQYLTIHYPNPGWPRLHVVRSTSTHGVRPITTRRGELDPTVIQFVNALQQIRQNKYALESNIDTPETLAQCTKRRQPKQTTQS